MGRRLFAILGPCIDALGMVLSLCPRRIALFVWALVSGTPGLLGIGLRYLIARRLAADIGDNVRIGPRCTFQNWEGISLGSNVSIHTGCYLDGRGGIEIGSDVSIAHGSSLLSFEHTWGDSSVPIKYNPLRSSPILIEDDVWVGCGVRILSGSIVRQRSVVAAAAVLVQREYLSGKHVGIPAKSTEW